MNEALRRTTQEHSSYTHSTYILHQCVGTLSLFCVRRAKQWHSFVIGKTLYEDDIRSF